MKRLILLLFLTFVGCARDSHCVHFDAALTRLRETCPHACQPPARYVDYADCVRDCATDLTALATKQVPECAPHGAARN